MEGPALAAGGRGVLRRTKAWRRRQQSDPEEHQREAGPHLLSGGLLDAALVDVEDPRQRDHHRKARSERDHDIREDLVGPAQAVHDGLDYLKDGERRDAVADERPEDATTLQLYEQGRGHRPSAFEQATVPREGSVGSGHLEIARRLTRVPTGGSVARGHDEQD